MADLPNPTEGHLPGGTALLVGRPLMSHTPDLFAGGGLVGALMRGHDWSDSPLGFPERWPQSLRTVVALLLQSRFPMFVAWGKDLGFLYNEAYAEILGAKHPMALGRSEERRVGKEGRSRWSAED